MADFIRTVIVNRDIPKASSNKNIHMCSKDPVDAKYIKYLQKFFPNMKFILMVRDIRAVMHSFLWRIKSKQSLSIHPDSLIQNWNTNVDQYVRDCKSLGPSGCLIVVYEQLVEHKERTLKKIVEFLNVEWADSMMNHEKFVGDRVLLSDTEWSTDQIVKPIYTDSVDAWVGKLPDDVLKLFNKSSNTLLEKLGYNPKANTSMNNTPI
jgi:protein-tyrosine sulfotransferase